jgi:hypothetical protein
VGSAGQILQGLELDARKIIALVREYLVTSRLTQQHQLGNVSACVSFGLMMSGNRTISAPINLRSVGPSALPGSGTFRFWLRPLLRVIGICYQKVRTGHQILLNLLLLPQCPNMVSFQSRSASPVAVTAVTSEDNLSKQSFQGPELCVTGFLRTGNRIGSGANPLNFDKRAKTDERPSMFLATIES